MKKDRRKKLEKAVKVIKKNCRKIKNCENCPLYNTEFSGKSFETTCELLKWIPEYWEPEEWLKE